MCYGEIVFFFYFCDSQGSKHEKNVRVGRRLTRDGIPRKRKARLLG